MIIEEIRAIRSEETDLRKFGITMCIALGVTPVGVLGRLFGGKFLDVRMRDSRDTYWICRKQGDESPAKYENQC